jgi:hypothetical protein
MDFQNATVWMAIGSVGENVFCKGLPHSSYRASEQPEQPFGMAIIVLSGREITGMVV